MIIGKVTMEVSPEQMIAMVEYCLNDEIFYTTAHPQNRVTVRKVRQRESGRFVVELNGPEPKVKSEVAR